MSKQPAIIVDNVSMKFNLSKEKVDSLKDYIIKSIKKEIKYNEFWALQNVSFTVEKGDRVGILGLNGAGKRVRVKVDDTDKSPGFKFAEQEMRGIPIRIECGPKDIENGQAVICRRDTREKYTVTFDELVEKVQEILETIQKDMLERARKHRDSHTYVATNYEEFKDTIVNKPGFVKAMWCGDRACEDKIKEDVQATSRCMPFEQEHLSDVCVCCGKPAKKMVYWGRAY